MQRHTKQEEERHEAQAIAVRAIAARHGQYVRDLGFETCSHLRTYARRREMIAHELSTGMASDRDLARTEGLAERARTDALRTIANLRKTIDEMEAVLTLQWEDVREELAEELVQAIEQDELGIDAIDRETVRVWCRDCYDVELTDEQADEGVAVTLRSWDAFEADKEVR